MVATPAADRDTNNKWLVGRVYDSREEVAIPVNPRTAEWAKECSHLFDRWGAHFHGALCLNCADAYAREQVEAALEDNGMIPDVTLAQRDRESRQRHSIYGEWVIEAHAEIRRLRIETQVFADEKCRWFLERAKKVEADLAAHQAVVRELAEALEAAQSSLCASSDYRRIPSNRYGLERIRVALAHPLVVAARREGRG